MKLSLMLAIDFTRSNGDPRARGSLHSFESSITAGVTNEYHPILSALAGRLESAWGLDLPIYAYGFGAKLPPSRNRVSHCFSLKGSFFCPGMMGKEKLLQSYREILGCVNVHGPTRFQGVLDLASNWAEHLSGTKSYLLTVILTDGAMEDAQQTIDTLVRLSNLPMSVLIVGVGDADFSLMHRLDGDHEPLISAVTGERPSRDFINFVRYRDFAEQSPREFADACLEELPRHLREYFSDHPIRSNISPPSEPRFLNRLKTELLVTIHNQGYEEDIAEHVIDDVGVLCPDPHHLLDLMFHLKRQSMANWTTQSVSSKAPLWERYKIEDRLRDKVEKMSANKRGSALMKSRNLADVVTAGVCRVCFTDYIDISLEPCGHEVVCMNCSSKIGKMCPLCRATIERVNIL
jgi:hypothetical protein